MSLTGMASFSRISRLAPSLSRISSASFSASSSLRGFCTNTHDSEDVGGNDLSTSEQSNGPQSTNNSRPIFQRPLENGLDVGIYKAILVGQVGQVPVQKRLRSGRVVTLFSLGTGGIRNNRRPLDDEDPMEYANRCAVQWHRVAVYPERLGSLAMQNVKPGSLLYLEGNLETKIFSDPITGLVKRIREIAIRRNGRLVFLGKETDAAESSQADLRGVGYF
ncbi:hypothetical protein AMTRI_Chr07g77210 [Amborella trichopoda]|uniref:Single-stranded DNA-binding protein n=1 Tax=Amborella trichopoda TaxID=13333 RepID=U5CZX7_AMBTC|nr:single-stranded DNA-binding protein, mitochondrial [Amborella trichopoda]ERN15729.1 hypothetical protein AMTR_s00039p00044370 [Amborella trichopoda]|eukprot:XP_006854262.1 single-stranded DNA-binding protein, mitochondrial [Amborella trichopoda]